MNTYSLRSNDAGFTPKIIVVADDNQRLTFLTDTETLIGYASQVARSLRKRGYEVRIETVCAFCRRSGKYYWRAGTPYACGSCRPIVVYTTPEPKDPTPLSKPVVGVTKCYGCSDVEGEVISRFYGTYVHIGGDGLCQDCRQGFKMEGI